VRPGRCEVGCRQPYLVAVAQRAPHHPPGVRNAPAPRRDDRGVQRPVAFVRRSLARFVELEGFDRAMALAGQGFAALLPLLIVVGAVTPAGGRDVAQTLIDRFDLTGSTAESLRAAVAQPAAVQDSVSVLSGFILLLAALAFTRALQRLYVRAWRLPRLGPNGNAWGLLWLGVFSAYWSLQPVIASVLDGAAAVVVSISLSCALWLFTPWLLVGKRLPWRRLLPQAVLTALGLMALAAAAAVYMPRAIGSAAAQFGVIGIAFSLLSWMFAAALVLVVTAALGATLAEPPGAAGERRITLPG
jgi:membrane protein